ncbi:RagB/SusD family nutrient uptake outer membrane protein [Solitalea sp. MAHUQ-68]|uniref:RagB/SusD family nutrient uptake outer membrane protein n=1 Tax=Solitalea agri TaxID=2953739 RepID=A0A9X2F243_9SPHI|nr:RagB/SusD family nutrient uptake outer membrane protein [Solitalea agri]MCO4292700.1 RagB/SusD family nutrient uptake outer membrane protein [Solitalea agri]
MKKTYILAGALFLTLSFTACKEDFLDKAPLDELSDQTFWKSEKDAQMALNSCYRNGLYGFWEVLYLDAMADNAYSQFAWDGFQKLGNGTMDAGYVDQNNFFTFKDIRSCNEFLAGVEKIQFADPAKKEAMKAEARFIRAMAYFYKVQFFGDVPLMTTPLSLQESNIPRTPKAEVVKFILDELGAIANALPNKASSSGKVSKAAVLALKARVELSEGKFAEAAASSQQVISMGNYNLFPNYESMFWMANQGNNEVIFDRQYMANAGDNTMWDMGAHLPNSEGGWSSIDPTQSLVDEYECTDGKVKELSSLYNPQNPYVNRDPRMSATIIYPGADWRGSLFNSLDKNSADYYNNSDNASETGYNLRKYMDPAATGDDVWNWGTNAILIRYAEVLLTYAEAKIEQNQIDASVYNAIDAVRQRAGMPVVDRTVYSNQDKLRELIRRERRVEFAMEGFRWFDLKRWNQLEKIGTPVYGVRDGVVNADGSVTLSGSNRLVEERIFATKNYLLPIPQAAIDISKGVLKQNKDY